MVRAAWELTDHDGARLAGGAGGGQLGVGWAASWLPAGSSITGKLMRWPSTVVLRVALADVGQHLWSQVDAVEHGAGAPQGDLVGGRACDEIVVSLLQLLAGDGFVFKNVYGLVGHFNASWPRIPAAKAV